VDLDPYIETHLLFNINQMLCEKKFGLMPVLSEQTKVKDWIGKNNNIPKVLHTNFFLFYPKGNPGSYMLVQL